MLGSVFASPLLSFMAVRSLTRHGAWQTPNDYLSQLNRLRYCFRLTLLGASRSEWLLMHDDSPRPLDDSAVRVTEALKGICEQRLCRDGWPPTVGTTLSCIFLYTRLVAFNPRPQGQVVWDCAL
jgi:hypothetical protein